MLFANDEGLPGASVLLFEEATVSTCARLGEIQMILTMTALSNPNRSQLLRERQILQDMVSLLQQRQASGF